MSKYFEDSQTHQDNDANEILIQRKDLKENFTLCKKENTSEKAKVLDNITAHDLLL